MRCILIFLISGTLHSVANSAYSQATKLSVEMNNVSLQEVLLEIERNSSFYFSYSTRQIDATRTVSVQLEDKLVTEILDHLFEGKEVNYTIDDKHIILYKSKIPYVYEATQLQKRAIQGKVTDTHGDPIIGANVFIKGTTQGVITDIDGHFHIEADPNITLVVSYIGYTTQEINAGSQTNISIILHEDFLTLDEVVVVGYGVQKKVNLTGSVASINMNELTESRPVTNLSNSLAGLAPGVFVTSNGSSPGNDNGSIMVRGAGTLNDTNPLVIIDGAEGDMSNLNPQDVESISVLKDAASAAIYGSRAANGVILITTKKGKTGTIHVNYNGYVSFENINKQGASFKTMSNYADFMEIQNEALINVGQTPRFSQEKIDLWRANEGGDSLLYPNTDWVEELYKTGVATNHVISLSGGTDKVTFYSSVGYMKNPGIVENSGFERYNMRVSVDAQIKPWIKLGANVNGYVGEYEPLAERVKDLGAINSTPGQVLRSPDGRYGAPQNPEDNIQAGNVLYSINERTGTWSKKNINTRLFASVNPFKGFNITGSITYDNLNEKKRWQPTFNDRWNFQTNTITMASNTRSTLNLYYNEETRLFMDAVATYDTKVLNKLQLSVLAGTSQEKYTRIYNQTSKYDLTDESLTVPDAAMGDAQLTGNGTQWVMRSYFGRLNLNWDEKYLLEANLRIDGSSRFLSDERWGYFPSVSAAWRIDQEDFMKDNFVSSLKLRASYGSLGNNGGNDVGNYDALSVYTASNYILNNGLVMGQAQKSISNAFLTWETTYITDIGIDFGLLKNKLTGTFDFFHKRTENILIDLPAPLVHGNASIPKQNAAEVINNGLELSLSWNDKIGKVNYFVNGNVTWLHNEVTKFKGDDYSLASNGVSMTKEGYPIGIQYVRIVDRLIQTDEDLAIVQKMLENAPLDENGNKRNAFPYGIPQKGDLLYKDLNGDGIVNDEDRTTIGSGSVPTYTFGLTVGANWNGFDCSVLLQGSAGVKCSSWMILSVR